MSEASRNTSSTRVEGAIDEQPEVAPRVTAKGSYTLGTD